MSTTVTARRGEARLPSALVVVAAIALYALLPEQLILGPRLVIPPLEVVLLVALIVINPRRMTRDNVWERTAALTLVGLIAVANAAALYLLLRQLVTTDDSRAVELLIAAGQVWLRPQHHRGADRVRVATATACSGVGVIPSRR